MSESKTESLTGSLSFSDLLRQAIDGATLENKTENKNNEANSIVKKVIAILLDRSGSTSYQFMGADTVLDKERQVVEGLVMEIAENPNNEIYCCQFGTDCTDPQQLRPLVEEGLVFIEENVPIGITNTHLGFKKALNEIKGNVADIYLVTDGMTTSNGSEIKNVVNACKDRGINVHCIAVTTTDTDLARTVTEAEATSIPGVELLPLFGNSLSTLKVYNRFHSAEPFIGATSSVATKGKLTFMGTDFKAPIPLLIRILCDSVETRKCTDWGSNDSSFKKMCTEIGKLLAALFVTAGDIRMNLFVNKVSGQLSDGSGINGMTGERVKRLVMYGFDCSRQGKHISGIDPERYANESFDASKRQLQYADAKRELEEKGTTLGSHTTISLPAKGIVATTDGGDPIKLNESIAPYPNSCDKHGNPYFSLQDQHAQATRIGIRQFLFNRRIIKDQKEHAAIFYVANEMALLYITGLDMDSPFMKKLQILARIQCGMNPMTGPGKYSSHTLYQLWEQGAVPDINFRKKGTHTQLYSNHSINPLGLNEPLWWALMMSMLGIYDQQLAVYKDAVTAFGANDNQESKEFLNQMRVTYGNRVTGKVGFLELKESLKSIMTLEEFKKEDELWKLDDHGDCKVGSVYDAGEKKWVMDNGCVWCHHKPNDNDFSQSYLGDDVQTLLAHAVKNAAPVSILPVGSSKSGNLGLGILESKSGFDPLGQVDQKDPGIVIVLKGPVGAGKTTVSESMGERLTDTHDVLIVGTDRYCKDGMPMQQAISTVTQSLHQHIAKPSDKPKVVIIDTCGERVSRDNKYFGVDFSGWQIKEVWPNRNLNKKKDKAENKRFVSWCLRNVLNRKACTPESNYWLNPDPKEAGINTCITVWRKKAQSLGLNPAAVQLKKGASLQEALEGCSGPADEYVANLRTPREEAKFQISMVFDNQ